jgi:hypothetical protein
MHFRTLEQLFKKPWEEVPALTFQAFVSYFERKMKNQVDDEPKQKGEKDPVKPALQKVSHADGLAQQEASGYHHKDRCSKTTERIVKVSNPPGVVSIFVKFCHHAISRYVQYYYRRSRYKLQIIYPG